MEALSIWLSNIHILKKKKLNKWMVDVHIKLSITWVHPQSTHAILHTHSMKFQALALESQFSFWFINCFTLYVVFSSDNHWYCLSLRWTYCVDPTFLGVIFTSLEFIFVFGVGFVLSSSSFVMFSLRLHGSSIMLSSLSSDPIILAFVHAMGFSSSTS